MNTKLITPLKYLVIVPYQECGKWDGVNWLLLTDIVFSINDKEYKIKSGFVTDFGSIPRVARITIDRMGNAIMPFVIHDWLREEKENQQPVTTKEADLILYRLGLNCGESKYTMNKIYYTLRCLGWLANVGDNQYALVDPETIKYIIDCHKDFDLSDYIKNIGVGKLIRLNMKEDYVSSENNNK